MFLYRGDKETWKMQIAVGPMQALFACRQRRGRERESQDREREPERVCICMCNTHIKSGRLGFRV